MTDTSKDMTKKQLGTSSLNYQLEASKLVALFLLVVPTTG